MNCQHCGSTNYLQIATCWRCGQPFVAASKEQEGAPGHYGLAILL